MNQRSGLDAVSTALYAIGLAAGIVELFFRPFLFGPIGVLVLLVAALMSGKNHRLGVTAAFVVATCFVIGAGIAVWGSHPLY